jgi:uncharacterized membrane protein (DUF2068 family)
VTAHALVGEPKPETAFRAIVLYKAIKAVSGFAVAAVFTVILVSGSSVHLHGVAAKLREHVTAAWAVLLADAVVSVTERRHLAVATAALALDGVITSVEWYALSRGRTWGEWLVVAATSSLIPFEVYELVAHGHLGRVVVLVVNIAIAAYLARHAWKKHQMH